MHVHVIMYTTQGICVGVELLYIRPGNTTPKSPSPRNKFSNHQSPRNKIANHQSPGNKHPNHQSPRNNILITNHQEIKYSLDIYLCPICHTVYIYVPYCIGRCPILYGKMSINENIDVTYCVGRCSMLDTYMSNTV